MQTVRGPLISGGAADDDGDGDDDVDDVDDVDDRVMRACCFSQWLPYLGVLYSDMSRFWRGAAVRRPFTPAGALGAAPRLGGQL